MIIERHCSKGLNFISDGMMGSLIEKYSQALPE